MGEVIGSYRNILKRPQYYYTMAGITSMTADTQNSIVYALPFFPAQPGYTPGATPLDKTTANVAYNFVPLTWLTWLAPCFLGWKGAIRWKIQTVDPTLASQATVNYRVATMAANTGFDGNAWAQASMATATSHSTTVRTALTDFANPGEACLLGSNPAQTGLEFESDPYSPWLFNIYMNSTNAENLTSYGSFSKGIQVFKYVSDTSTAAGNDQMARYITDRVYVSASDDFNFVNFKFAPVIYLQTNRPGASATL